MTDARELVEQVARAWASMDDNADRFDACKADPSLDETEGRYIGYMADAEALMERSGITALAERVRVLEGAVEAVIQFHNSTFTGPCAAQNKGRQWKGVLRKCLNARAALKGKSDA